MPVIIDGPASPRFKPVTLAGNFSPADVPARVADGTLAPALVEAVALAPENHCVHRGMAFDASHWLLAHDRPQTITLHGLRQRWLVISHASDLSAENRQVEDAVVLGGGKVRLLGPPAVGHQADYRFEYEDGSSVTVTVHGMRQIGPFMSRLDENCSEAVTHLKEQATPSALAGRGGFATWGYAQTGVFRPDVLRQWNSWLWAWHNPHPDRPLASLSIIPRGTAVMLFGLSAGDVAEHPLRWRQRRKAVLRMPDGVRLDPGFSDHATSGLPFAPLLGGSNLLKLDLGQVISVQPRLAYPGDDWDRSPAFEPPQPVAGEVLVEYTSHAQAHFHLADGATVSVEELERADAAGALRVVPPARRRVRLNIVDARSGERVAARVHIHGAHGEYLPPIDHHRIPNPHWFQDFGADHVQASRHYSAYVDGRAELLLPDGAVYLEISKGFEIAPQRVRVEVDANTDEIRVPLEQVLDWRAAGWVTADTHVHFLSPQAARLEGAGEGLDVVNLLASQWGEMFTNVADFDGRTTIGEHDPAGETLVRVGTENRQGFLGHISLLGYEGELIRPLSAGGPAESALGDPLNVLLTDWARRCKAQSGTVVIPHFPLPRAEHAATIIAGLADAMELTSLGAQAQGGFSPYAIADWYRYLNCGYFVAAVGGTDKMSAATAIGAGRTYARLRPGESLSYRAWQDAVERGETFVTFGPLLDFAVDGRPAGSRIRLSRDGGTLDLCWRAQSVMIPMSRAELVVNGEIRESVAIDARQAAGQWRVTLDRSSWLALLIRGQEPGEPEVISAHSSPVMVSVEDSEFLAAADALTILEQIEGSLIYLDTLGTRADTETFKSMKLTLTAVHKRLHARLHAAGVEHDCAIAPGAGP